MTADQRHWLLRRLHSLSGIIPIGGFFIFPYFRKCIRAEGRAGLVEGDRVHPQHSAAGRGPKLRSCGFQFSTMRFTESSSPLPRSRTITPSSANYQYTLQRISGILAFLFNRLRTSLTTRAYFYTTGGRDRLHADA